MIKLIEIYRKLILEYREKNIFHAIQNSDVEYVKNYINSGHNINIQNIPFGSTPLHWSVGTNNIKITKLLLSQPDINVNIQNKKGSTPLHWCLDKGIVNYEMVMLLIKAGADVWIKNKKGITPYDMMEEKGIW